MGWWLVDADTLAGSRFVVSPLAETVAALLTLRWDRATHPGEQRWLAGHREEYRRHLAERPVLARLVEAVCRPRWIADFATQPPDEKARGYDEEIAGIRGADPAWVRTDLTEALGGPLPGELDRDDLAALFADLLDWVWERAIRGDWARREHLLAGDVLARTRQLSLGGWEAALDGMRADMRWLGKGRLQINALDYPPRDIAGGPLLFVPVTMGRGWAAWREPSPGSHALVYPVAGPLADDGRTVAPGALRRLLGPQRARILVLLGTPRTTTQLVALTGRPLGSVGRHLRILHDAGLTTRRRAGRSVLYARTEAAEVLVAAAGR